MSLRTDRLIYPSLDTIWLTRTTLLPSTAAGRVLLPGCTRQYPVAMRTTEPQKIIQEGQQCQLGAREGGQAADLRHYHTKRENGERKVLNLDIYAYYRYQSVCVHGIYCVCVCVCGRGDRDWQTSAADLAATSGAGQTLRNNNNNWKHWSYMPLRWPAAEKRCRP